jgi:DNA-binding Xre family transcriptional regulator
MSLRDLAEIVGLTDSHLSRAENGKRGIHISKLQRIADVFQVPVGELMNTNVDLSRRADVAPFTPPKGSVLEKAFTSTTQKLFKVLSNCLSELGITDGDPIVVDVIPLTVADLQMGEVVVAEVGGDDPKKGVLVLRQFIGPNLLATNSADNNSMPIHILRARAKIIGRVMR